MDRVPVETPPQDAVLIMNSDGKHEHADCCRHLRRQGTIQSDVRSPRVRASFLPVFLATCSQRVLGSHLLYCGGDFEHAGDWTCVCLVLCNFWKHRTIALVKDVDSGNHCTMYIMSPTLTTRKTHVEFALDLIDGFREVKLEDKSPVNR